MSAKPHGVRSVAVIACALSSVAAITQLGFQIAGNALDGVPDLSGRGSGFMDYFCYGRFNYLFGLIGPFFQCANGPNGDAFNGYSFGPAAFWGQMLLDLLVLLPIYVYVYRGYHNDMRQNRAISSSQGWAGFWLLLGSIQTILSIGSAVRIGVNAVHCADGSYTVAWCVQPTVYGLVIYGVPILAAARTMINVLLITLAATVIYPYSGGASPRYETMAPGTMDSESRQSSGAIPAVKAYFGVKTPENTVAKSQ